MTIRLAGIEKHSAVNGPGIRYVIFTQGCTHACQKCQNPETWNLNGGKEYPLDLLINDIFATKFIDGITLSGGDPLLQSPIIIELCKKVKERGLNIWCYTGFTFEEILSGKAGADAIEALKFIDVLVDSPFIVEKLSKECIFRGSSNQRLIDCKSSLDAGTTIEIKPETMDFGL
ncbi:MAG: anaerobic ribonucleoside-triphosphate reductase activating protein [Bacilli bacterium]